MKTMKKVYVVTAGEYSDYRIEAVFSTKEKAENYINTFYNYEFNGIDEYELDLVVVDYLREGYTIYKVFMLYNGDVEKIEVISSDSFNIDNMMTFIWKRSSVLAHKNDNLKDILVCQCWAKSEDHAIKIANEKRVQMIESGEFK